MKYLAAYLLAVLGGDKAPSKEKVSGILGSVGIDAEEEAIDNLISSLDGKNLETLVEEGSERLSSVIGAGGGAGAAPATGTAAGGDAAEEEKPQEEEEDESSEEEVGGLGLFGDDSDEDSD